LPIGSNDLWIAAHALAVDGVLVTRNVQAFCRIKSLKVEKLGVVLRVVCKAFFNYLARKATF